MKQIFFNELTLNATPEENRLWLEGFLKVLKQLANKTGKKVNRVFAEGKVLDRLCECVWGVEDNNLRNEVSAYLTGIYDPNDEGVDGRIRDRYLGVEYNIKLGTTTKPCPSLGWAYLNDSITIGFASGSKWVSCALHQIIETPLEGEVRIVDDVVCVVNPLQLDDEYVRTWLDVNFGAEIVDVQLPQPCNIDPLHEPATQLQREGRIIVLGVVDNEYQQLRQIVQEFGLALERFEFYKYTQIEAANFNCAKFKNPRSIAAILIGAAPHKVDGMGEAPSFLFALQHQDGYPPVETLSRVMEKIYDSKLGIHLYRSKGKYAVTPSSFRCGLFNLLQRKIIVAV